MNRKISLLIKVAAIIAVCMLFYKNGVAQAEGMTDASWMNMADKEIFLEHYENALNQALVNVGEHNLRFHYLAGICYENLEQWDEAINHFQAAIEMKAENERSMAELSYIGLGRALMGSGKYPEAIDVFRIVVQKYYMNVDRYYPRYPNYSDDNKNEIRIIADDAQFAIGECYEKLGDAKKALNAFAMMGRFYPFSRKTLTANEKVAAFLKK